MSETLSELDGTDMVEYLIPSSDIPRIQQQQQEPSIVEYLTKQIPLNEKIPSAKEELPSTLGQEKRPARGAAIVSGYLVTFLALLWWFQPSQPLSGSQMRTLEESVVRETQPANAESTVLPDLSRSDGYTIQVGAFGNQESARRVLSQLLARSYAGRMVQPEMGEDRYYYVWSGQFTSRAQALRIQTELKADGFATYIKKVAAQ